MKKLLLILLILPLLTFGQASSWRTNPPAPQRSTPSIQPSVQPSVQPSLQPFRPQRNEVSSWRNNPPRNNVGQPNVIIPNPYSNNWGWNNWGWNNWGWNNWNMLGAPVFGWNHWSPMWYQNDWGYRQPARVYMYDNGKRDTIRGKKPIISFGIQTTTDKQIGGFFTIGNKAYFIAEYNSTFERDNSTFFPYGNITQVDFPMVSDFVERRSFYVGVGKRIKRTGVHMMIGSVTEDVKWRGKDDFGYITFPKYIDRFTTVKVGALHDYKNFTIKLDYDPVINNGTIGLGVNF
jgi:hypothetical protein